VKNHKSHAVKSSGNGLGDGSIILIFIALVFLIIFFYGQNSVDTDQKILLSKLVIDHKEEGGPAIIIGNKVDVDRLREISLTDYSELKSLIGITSEFVIYFEDGEGNILDLGDKPCIGSSYAQVNGHQCS